MNCARRTDNAGFVDKDSLFDLSPLMSALAAASLNPGLKAIFFVGAAELAHIFVTRIATARRAAARILDCHALTSPALAGSFFSLLGRHDIVLFIDHDCSDAASCKRRRRVAHDALAAPASFTCAFHGDRAALERCCMNEALSLVIDMSSVRDEQHARAITASMQLAMLLGEAAGLPMASRNPDQLAGNSHFQIRAMTARVNQITAEMAAGARDGFQELDTCREKLLELIASSTGRTHNDSPPDTRPQLGGLIEYWRER
ncbi:MAG: hypothetical protein H7176_10825 [Bdellovibrionales bacterium]|nr:hypothetical protein [Massilia sp.]